MCEVIAFGDDVGDFEMISEAGVGVLMKNAKPSLIEEAGKYKNVTVSEYSNDEDGVARFIADYFGFCIN
jgi:hydroxymethylpyrimidine pyrophosphatase-like HAD family hydrolase